MLLPHDLLAPPVATCAFFMPFEPPCRHTIEGSTHPWYCTFHAGVSEQDVARESALPDFEAGSAAGDLTPEGSCASAPPSPVKPTPIRLAAGEDATPNLDPLVILADAALAGEDPFAENVPTRDAVHRRCHHLRTNPGGFAPPWFRVMACVVAAGGCINLERLVKRSSVSKYNIWRVHAMHERSDRKPRAATHVIVVRNTVHGRTAVLRMDLLNRTADDDLLFMREWAQRFEDQ